MNKGQLAVAKLEELLNKDTVKGDTMKLYHVQTPVSMQVIAAKDVFTAEAFAVSQASRSDVSGPMRIEEVPAETFDEVTAEMVLIPDWLET